MLSSTFQTSINVGILLAYIAGRYLTWQWLAAVSIIPLIILTFGLLSLPESPRYLLTVHRRQEAKHALQKLRHPNFNPLELQRLEETQNSVSSSPSNQGFLDSKLKKRAFLLAASILVIQQTCGVNIVVFYTEMIYKNAGVKDTNLASIYVGLANIIATIISGNYVDRMGRKALLKISGIGMAFFLGVFSWYFHATTKISWIGLVCPVGFIIFFAFGFGPIPFVLAGEILPASIKEKALAIGNAATWTFSFLLTLSFNSILVPVFTTAGTFAIFTVITLIDVWIISSFFVETRGKSLDEIQVILAQ